MIPKLPLLLALSLAACAADPPQRFGVPQIDPGEARVAIAFRSVEVQRVALPSYAQSDEIYIEDLDGALTSDPAVLWADEPARATTLELARALAALTGARVAPEPWPFDDYAQARVDVRVEEFLARRAGEFRLTGQFFVAPFDGSNRDRARRFAISVPLSPEAGPRDIAAARAQAMADLAGQIARDGLR